MKAATGAGKIAGGLRQARDLAIARRLIEIDEPVDGDLDRLVDRAVVAAGEVRDFSGDQTDALAKVGREERADRLGLLVLRDQLLGVAKRLLGPIGGQNEGPDRVFARLGQPRQALCRVDHRDAEGSQGERLSEDVEERVAHIASATSIDGKPRRGVDDREPKRLAQEIVQSDRGAQACLRPHVQLRFAEGERVGLGFEHQVGIEAELDGRTRPCASVVARWRLVGRRDVARRHRAPSMLGADARGRIVVSRGSARIGQSRFEQAIGRVRTSVELRPGIETRVGLGIGTTHLDLITAGDGSWTRELHAARVTAAGASVRRGTAVGGVTVLIVFVGAADVPRAIRSDALGIDDAVAVDFDVHRRATGSTIGRGTKPVRQRIVGAERGRIGRGSGGTLVDTRFGERYLLLQLGKRIGQARVALWHARPYPGGPLFEHPWWRETARVAGKDRNLVSADVAVGISAVRVDPLAVGRSDRGAALGSRGPACPVGEPAAYPRARRPARPKLVAVVVIGQRPTPRAAGRDRVRPQPDGRREELGDRIVVVPRIDTQKREPLGRTRGLRRRLGPAPRRRTAIYDAAVRPRDRRERRAYPVRDSSDVDEPAPLIRNARAAISADARPVASRVGLRTSWIAAYRTSGLQRGGVLAATFARRHVVLVERTLVETVGHQVAVRVDIGRAAVTESRRSLGRS